MEAPKNKPGAFEPHSLQDWQKTAAAELQGGDPWKKLTRTVQGLTIKPYYTQEDAPAQALRMPPAQDGVFGPRTWFNCPFVSVTDEASANQQALAHLENGADGILFQLTRSVDFNILLKKIEWPYSSLSFLASTGAESDLRALTSFMKSIPGSTLGAWYGPAGLDFPGNGNFRPFGYRLGQSDSPARDIAAVLQQIIQTLGDKIKTRGHEVAICVELGTDFFIEIAKLRAIRQTWQRLLQSKQVSDQHIHLHGWSRAWTSEAYAPHGNMIRGTSAAMAAILGGCDGLTIDADKQEEMEVRIARNVAILLRDESRFAKVADPLAGSWYVDSLAAQLAEQVWDHLQTAAR